MELSDGRRLRCKAVIAADGVKSKVAAKLGLKPAKYAGEVYYRWRSTSAFLGMISSSVLHLFQALPHYLQVTRQHPCLLRGFKIRRIPNQ